MFGKWLRFVIGGLAAAIVGWIGLVSLGSPGEADPNTGLVPGAANYMLIFAVALLVGVVAYAIVEFEIGRASCRERV